MFKFLEDREEEAFHWRVFYAAHHQARYLPEQGEKIRAVLGNEQRMNKFKDDIRTLVMDKYQHEVAWMEGVEEDNDPTPAHPFLIWMIVHWNELAKFIL
jgi:hypothetical protein